MNTNTDCQNIAILVNALSGKGKSTTICNQIREKLLLKKIAFEIYLNNWPTSLKAFTDIWLIGGDGTINYFLNKYTDNDLPLVFFKGGTGNDLAWKLYGNIGIAEQIEVALMASPKKIDAILCNDRIFVNSSGIGFDGEVLRSINTIRWLGGHLGYLSIVLRKIFQFRELQFNIKTDSENFHGKFLLVIANNSSRTGGGFMVTPQAEVNDGKLDLVLCKPLSILHRLRYLPVIEKGKHLKLPFITFRQVSNVIIECEHDVFAQMDGELIKARVFNMKVLKDKLLVKY